MDQLRDIYGTSSHHGQKIEKKELTHRFLLQSIARYLSAVSFPLHKRCCSMRNHWLVSHRSHKNTISMAKYFARLLKTLICEDLCLLTVTFVIFYRPQQKSWHPAILEYTIFWFYKIKPWNLSVSKQSKEQTQETPPVQTPASHESHLTCEVKLWKEVNIKTIPCLWYCQYSRLCLL